MLGRHLQALQLNPGPHFKPLLDAAFEAQLDGAFADEAGGIAWLQTRLKSHPIEPSPSRASTVERPAF